jgi:anti-sigma B factor antagonist
MEMLKTSSGNIAVLQLKGRFDAHEVVPVGAWLQEQVDAGRVQIIINLEAVNFIDSTALSSLVRGLKHCREKGGELRLCCLQQPVRVIFELTRLDKAFTIHATQPEAVDALQ